MDVRRSAPNLDDYLVAHSILTDARTDLEFRRLAIPDGVTSLGQALIELSAKVGVSTIVCVHNAAQEESLKVRGATHVIRRGGADFAQEVMRLTDGKGVEVVVDQMAGPGFAKNFDMLADFGSVLVTGWTNGDAPKLFETLWAALDRCPCMQLWTIDRYHSDPDRKTELERDVRALLEDRSRLRSEIGA